MHETHSSFSLPLPFLLRKVAAPRSPVVSLPPARRQQSALPREEGPKRREGLPSGEEHAVGRWQDREEAAIEIRRGDLEGWEPTVGGVRR
jgi:hypothetical protein